MDTLIWMKNLHFKRYWFSVTVFDFTDSYLNSNQNNPGEENEQSCQQDGFVPKYRMTKTKVFSSLHSMCTFTFTHTSVACAQVLVLESVEFILGSARQMWRWTIPWCTLAMKIGLNEAGSTTKFYLDALLSSKCIDTHLGQSKLRPANLKIYTRVTACERLVKLLYNLKKEAFSCGSQWFFQYVLKFMNFINK